MIKKFIAELLEEFNDIRFAASSLAFSTILSIIPFLIIILAVFQYIGGLEQFYPKIEFVLLSYLKEATGNTATKYIKASLENIDPGAIGISGILFLLWASLGLIRNIDFTINKIWKIKISKPMYKRMWLYWCILIAVPIGLAIFAGLKSINLLNDINRNIHPQFLFFIFSSVFLYSLYKVIPDTKVKAAPSLISAVAASLSLTVVQSSFLWFSVKVFKHNKIYGSLASLPIFLVWILTVWYVVLAGASFCAFLQQKSSKSP